MTWPPATMATPHPDNAEPPPWQSEALIGSTGEVEECLRAFEETGCQEYMWDWEGKEAEDTLPVRLLTEHEAFFRCRPLGRSLFLTIRLPNPHCEPSGRLWRALKAVCRARKVARDMGLSDPPVFEAIVPQTSSVEDLLRVRRMLEGLEELTGSGNGAQSLNLIPLLESVDALLGCGEIVKRFLSRAAHAGERFPRGLRVFVARSDPALESGLVPARLAAQFAIATLHCLRQEVDLAIHPILGVGSLPFRGGFSPHRYAAVMTAYPGVHTVTIQSGFRYGYPLDDVRLAVAEINRRLSAPSSPLAPPPVEKLRALIEAFRLPYQETVVAISGEISTVAALIPPRRSRYPFFGDNGYARRVGRTKLPRAVTFTGALYSLGVPPELIGTGRGLKELRAVGLLRVLDQLSPGLPEELYEAGRYLNRENLRRLAREQPAWEAILEDVRGIEEYLGTPLGPQTAEDEAHAEATAEFLAGLLAGAPVPGGLMTAARLRRSLG